MIVEAVLGVAGIAVIAGCVLAWRLGQGPIDITALVQREAPRLAQGGTRVTIGQAALTWEGFRDPDAPLDIRWHNVAIVSGDRTAPILLPGGRVTLSVSRLVVGQIVPRAVEVDGATLQLTHEASGAMRLDFGQPAEPAAPVAQDSQAGPAGGSAAAFLHDLASPPHPGRGLPFLAQLRQIHVRNAVLNIHNVALNTDWQAHASRVDLRRQPDGRITGAADLAFAAGPAHATMSVQANVSPAGTHLIISTSPLSPASLTNVAPGFAPLAAVDVPIDANVDATLDPKLAVQTLTAALHAGGGTLHAGTGMVTVRDADIRLQAAPAPGGGLAINVPSLRITLLPPTLSKGPAPTLTAHAAITRDAAGMHCDFAAELDHAAFMDLPAYWPPGTGGGSRPWLVQNITGGMAQNGHVQGTLTAAADFSNIALTALTGGISASDLTVYWLRPVPPIEHASGKLTIDGPDALHIDMQTGIQGPIRLSDGRMKITGITHKDQFGDISVHAEGGVADTVALLNHPRLNLLSRRRLPIVNPSGSASATVTVRMPLDARVTFEQIAIAAKAALSNVHLSRVAAGRDLDQGQLALAVDTNSLSITGTGIFGGIPGTLGLDMDFRDGPPSQVLEHATAAGSATPAQVVTVGLPEGIMTAGTAALNLDYLDRRDGSGEVALAANLRDSALATPIGWAKQRGQDATASARLRLTNDSLTGIDQIRASGPNLRIASHVESLAGQLRVLRLDQVQIAQTSATGSITAPRTPADPLRVTLRGPKLDLSTFFKTRDTNATPEDDTKRGMPWSVDLNFDQVVLARDETLSQVLLHAEDDGLRVTAGQLTAGPSGQVRASITKLTPAAPRGPKPAGGAGASSPPVNPAQPSVGRKLTIDASDAGAVLLAAGVADNVRGGRLRVDGVYDDTLPHSPLNGTATLEQFRITNAPAIGRLLKAVTLYGAVDLLRGPGLGFQKALVPFRWQQRVLHLQSARAFSASLGITAQGDIDLRQHIADVTGTIVPAYFFNQMLGKIPLLGELFSPEKGGGVFAARYSVHGKLGDPKISVNPLSALTPGFLRNVFGLF